MKITNLIVALFFVFGLCAGAVTGEATAASPPTKSTVEQSAGKKVKKAKKEKKAKKADTKSEKKAKKKSSKVAKSEKKKPLPAAKSISLNKATKGELTTLPGIGPKTADAIIAYRKSNKFSAVEDITRVKGIGDKTFAKIKKYLKP